MSWKNFLPQKDEKGIFMLMFTSFSEVPDKK